MALLLPVVDPRSGATLSGAYWRVEELRAIFPPGADVPVTIVLRAYCDAAAAENGREHVAERVVQITRSVAEGGREAIYREIKSMSGWRAAKNA